MRTVLREQQRGRPPDPARGSGDDGDATVQRSSQVAIGQRLGIETALPVVPHLPRIRRQRRALDAGSFESREGVVAREYRAARHIADRRLRDPHTVQQPALQRLSDGPVLEHCGRLFRQHRAGPAVHAQRELRRVRGAAELIDHLAKGTRARVGQVEGAAVEPFAVRDGVHRPGDEIDRDEVEPPALEPDERHPRGQRVAQPLDELEGVVRAVDAVGLAGLG